MTKPSLPQNTVQRKGYLITLTRAIKDHNKFEKYLASVQASMPKEKGLKYDRKTIAHDTNKTQLLEGHNEWVSTELCHISEFDSYQLALNWYYSDEYQKSYAITKESVDRFLTVVEGLPGVSADENAVTPKGYFIVFALDIKDPTKFKKYSEQAQLAYSKYGAKSIVRHVNKVQLIEGPEVVRQVLVEFNSYQQALDCYHSDEYQKALGIAKDTMDRLFTICEG